MRYDYIIVGTGAAGSVLAERLSASGEHSILVLEAGGADRNPMHLVPKGWVFTMQNEKYIRTYQPEPFGDETVEVWPRGIIDGGSTTVNGLGWNTGEASAYEWGVENWNWAAFRDAFDKIENRRTGLAARNPKYGRMNVEMVGSRSEFGDAAIKALESRGARAVADANLADGDRVSYASANTRRGLRWSAASAFLRPARRRKNVTVVNQANVLRVVFSGTTAIGVEAEVEGRLETFLAGREVLLSAGSLESPMLLERSGIGRSEVLREAGVELLVESPNVGENLSEHRAITLLYHLNDGLGFNHEINSFPKQMVAGAKFLMTRRGPISSGSYDVIAMRRLDEDSPGVDTQIMMAAISYGEGMQPEQRAGGLIGAYPMVPTSRGSIHITGPRASDPPRIVAGYYETEHDRAMIVKAMHEMRATLATPQMQAMGATEYYPGPAVTTDAEIVHHSLNYGPYGYHALGACAVGAGQDSVVDSRLRVRGTQGLRVVDASIFPHQPSGNNSGPTSAAAWIAADLILTDAAAYQREKIGMKPLG